MLYISGTTSLWLNWFLTLLLVFVIRIDANDHPNLLIIFTDEHSYKTIGAYRKFLSYEDAHPWGEGVKVETPHLDSIAKSGALLTNFYATSPLCTPSRASFMSGLYPESAGAWKNHQAMDEDVITFAQVLRNEIDAYTGYIGKWHLNGKDKPGFANPTRKFGFEENDYQYNRGHWKFFKENKKGIEAFEWQAKDSFSESLETNYATDFLFQRGIRFLKKAQKQDKPFTLFLSIPDPHGPDVVRPPYDSMYDSMKFDLPHTAAQALMKKPALPKWSMIRINDLGESEQRIKDLKKSESRQRHLRNIFGMVKLVDDSIGNLLDHLKSTGMYNNTVIVFTSDHGDMMGEHGKFNKGRPFDTSAGVPFLISWPGKIKAGKVIESAYSSVDFAPTILNVMGIDTSKYDFQGIDKSKEVLNDESVSSIREDRYITDSKQGKWAAAVNERFKLVLSKSDIPWLFDFAKDPYETVNHYGDDPFYMDVANSMMSNLMHHMEEHSFPLLKKAESVMLSSPTCNNFPDQLDAPSKVECLNIFEDSFRHYCDSVYVSLHCSVACQTCCKDSPGEIYIDGGVRNCDYIAQHQDLCTLKHAPEFCPETCTGCRRTAYLGPITYDQKSHMALPNPKQVEGE